MTNRILTDEKEDTMLRRLMSITLYSFLLFGVILALESPVLAQSTSGCGPHDRMMTVIESRYGEVGIFKGLAGESGYMGVWVNPETQSWTILAVYSSGITCPVASGTGYGLMHPEDMTKEPSRPFVGPDR